MLDMMKAVLWDFGGVILTSPFEAFRRYEIEHGLPVDFIRTVNTHEPAHQCMGAAGAQRDHAASEFDELFAAESEALGSSSAGRRCAVVARGRRAAARWWPCSIA